LGDVQRFEGQPLSKLLEMTQEELRDVAAYAIMLSIRIRRLQEAYQVIPGKVMTVIPACCSSETECGADASTVVCPHPDPDEPGCQACEVGPEHTLIVKPRARKVKPAKLSVTKAGDAQAK
jgi:hypothetical protein